MDGGILHVWSKVLEWHPPCAAEGKQDMAAVFAGRGRGLPVTEELASGDANTETPVLWPPHVKSWLIGKDPDAGRDWGQEEKGMTEDEMAGWHHLLDGREFEWTPGVGDGQGGLTCCDLWGRKELDMTEQLNWLTRLISYQGIPRGGLAPHCPFDENNHQLGPEACM